MDIKQGEAKWDLLRWSALDFRRKDNSTEIGLHNTLVEQWSRWKTALTRASDFGQKLFSLVRRRFNDFASTGGYI